MQIVIDIPEEEYVKIKESAKHNAIYLDLYLLMQRAITDGTPLPKGHEDLVDRNDLKYEKYNSYAYAIANAPTII